MMISIQQTINKELFQQNNERLKYLITVIKPHKKKSKSQYFLAIVVNDKNCYCLSLIKKTDNNLRKDKTWNFDEIQQIDAKYDSVEPEFEMYFSSKQSYRWIANSQTEKLSFLQSIKQIINQVPAYFDIKFVNVVNGQPTSALVYNQLDDISTSEKIDAGDWNQEDGSYQALTSREEADLERLIELEVENTINNAEAFTEKLSRDLALMDSSNIQDIMTSEQQVLDLMQILQNAIDETFRLENKIVYYESLLKNIRDIVQKVERKEAIVQTYNDNSNRLLSELGELTSRLDFEPQYETILDQCDLTSFANFSKCFDAALKLQEVIQYETSPTLNRLRGVNEQRRYLNGIAMRFSSRLLEQMKTIIVDLTNEYSRREPVLSEHALAHNKLTNFTPFIKWIRNMDPESYLVIMDFYATAFRNIYDREFAEYFAKLRANCLGMKGTSSPSSVESKRKSLGVVDTKSEMMRRSSYTPSTLTDTMDTISTRSSEVSFSDWDEFDSYIEFSLKTIDPVCLAEQQFCNKFFDLENQPNESMPSTPIFNKQSPNSESDSLNQSMNQSSTLSEQSTHSKKNDQLRTIMAELFKSFETEFINFVLTVDKVIPGVEHTSEHDRTKEGLYYTYFFVRLNNHVMSAQDSGSFLSKAYGNILIIVKRQFDKFMEEVEMEIATAKDPKRTKIGVLSFIKKFEKLAKQIENIVKYTGGNKVQRRSEIDKKYVSLMKRIFDSVSRIAKEHQKIYKTPSQMIEIENYHYLQIMLSSLKISCLENERKLAKAHYNNALKEYVNLYFRRPLDKLNIFFEGVQQKVQQGVREEEIGYQLAFSKQELRKVIKDCNLKDIKKGLEEMYRRVEKHVSDPESTLIQVIWRSMQEEFITQYKYIQEMIEKCYPQANINLLFTIEDVLNIFSEIAQTH